MFRDVKVGDRVWDIRFGYGRVHLIDPCSAWPIKVEFSGDASDSYTYAGKQVTEDINPTLFWDEIVIKVPEKPVRLVERTFEGWVNLYDEMQPYFHPNQDRATGSANKPGHLGSFSVKMVVSGVPEGFTFSKVEGWGLNELA